MILEMRKQLDEAEVLFAKMSELLITSMTEQSFSVCKRNKLLELDAEYQRILANVLESVAKIYPGRIEIFPIKYEEDFISGMEQKNAQFEELEQIMRETNSKKRNTP
jgi:hypothetical protein